MDFVFYNSGDPSLRSAAFGMTPHIINRRLRYASPTVNKMPSLQDFVYIT